MSDVKTLRDAEIHEEIVRIENAWERIYLDGKRDEADALLSRRNALTAEQAERKVHSAPSVIRLRFLAGEVSRDLDRACGEALGWRVSKDAWWNWHPGPVFDPPGDEWCIRKDGRKDTACNEALPHFTAEMFEKLLASAIRSSHEYCI